MIDFIGSKQNLLPWLFDCFLKHGANPGSPFLDACLGTGSVSMEAIRRGFKVVGCDLMMFPIVYTAGRVGMTETALEECRAFMRQINAIPENDLLSDGYFYNNYSVSAGRQYFTDLNAKVIDTARLRIQEGSFKVLRCKAYLICCLLEAMSKVSNTAGTHGAFLKSIKSRAAARLTMREIPCLLEPATIGVDRGDIVSILADPNKVFQEEVLYLDPPYTKRQYAPNYHLYETLVLYDSPEIKGKTGLRAWRSEADSAFCRVGQVEEYFSSILRLTTARRIFISYNSDGLLPIGRIQEIAKSTLGDVRIEVESVLYKRYKADSKRTYRDDELYEYLVVIYKD